MRPPLTHSFTHSKTFATLAARDFASLKVKANLKLFDRRTECIEWHPQIPHALTVASHGGDVFLLRNSHCCEEFDQQFCDLNLSRIREGKGKGGCILSLRYDPIDTTVFYVTGHDSKLTAVDTHTSGERALLDTQDYDHWYTSVDVSAAHSLIAAVDNKGALITLDRRAPSSSTAQSGVAGIVPQGHRQGPAVRCHRGKANHVEFSKDGNTLATSGNDRAVRLWDIRKVDSGSCGTPKKGEVGKGCLATLVHDGNITCANFCPVHSARLLTTAQNDELRVYDLMGGSCTEPLTIVQHPHRFYQHITVIKAAWHPVVEGLAVVGRYDSTRGIDLYDMTSLRGTVIATDSTSSAMDVDCSASDDEQDTAPATTNSDDADDDADVDDPDNTGTVADTAGSSSRQKQLALARHRGIALCNLQPPSDITTLMCVNKISPDGSVLASVTSTNVVLWDRQRLCSSSNTSTARTKTPSAFDGRPPGSGGSGGAGGDSSSGKKGGGSSSSSSKKSAGSGSSTSTTAKRKGSSAASGKAKQGKKL